MNFAKPASRITSISLAPTASDAQRRWPISYRSVGAIALASDAVIILSSGIVSGILYNLEMFNSNPAGDVPHFLGAAAVVAALFVSVMKGHGLYDPAEVVNLKAQIGSIVSTWLGVFLFLAGAVFALKIGDQFSRGTILLFFTTGLGLLVLHRILYRALLRRG